MFVELIQHKTHAVHETVHIGRFSFVIRCSAMRCESPLKCFKILHPLYSEIMWLNVRFVEDEDERKFCFVQDTKMQRLVTKKLSDRNSIYLQAYSMFDMNVAGELVLGVSMIYATTVGNEPATASVIMAPDADQVKISICPGVSRIT